MRHVPVLMVTEGGDSIISTTVCDEEGHPLSNSLVEFSIDRGNIDPFAVSTDIQGVAVPTFKAIALLGQATIIARGESLEAKTTVEVRPSSESNEPLLKLGLETPSLRPRQVLEQKTGIRIQDCREH
jgi:hypothetical protein